LTANLLFVIFIPLMLTQSDLQAIAKLVDQKLDQKLVPIQTKISEMEQNMATKSDIGRIRGDLITLENRLAKVESLMVTKADAKAIATVFDLRKAFRGVVRQKDLNAMERRLTKRINLVSDSVDERVLRIEKHLNLSPVISS
jgi:DNA repair exonuclease SbcCD ATPase subunit